MKRGFEKLSFNLILILILSILAIIALVTIFAKMFPGTGKELQYLAWSLSG